MFKASGSHIEVAGGGVTSTILSLCATHGYPLGSRNLLLLYTPQLHPFQLPLGFLGIPLQSSSLCLSLLALDLSLSAVNLELRRKRYHPQRVIRSARHSSSEFDGLGWYHSKAALLCTVRLSKKLFLQKFACKVALCQSSASKNLIFLPLHVHYSGHATSVNQSPFSTLRKMYPIVQNFIKAVSQIKRLCIADKAPHIELAQVQFRTDWANSRCRQLATFKIACKATRHVSKEGKRGKVAKKYN